MNTLSLSATLYRALEDEAAKTGRQVDDLAAEAIKSWLSEAHVEGHGQQDCTSLFKQLAEDWHRDRPRGVDVADMVMHPSYQRIIGMGEDAVSLILNELNRRPDHWFWALYSITGAKSRTRGLSGQHLRDGECMDRVGSEEWVMN